MYKERDVDRSMNTVHHGYQAPITTASLVDACKTCSAVHQLSMSVLLGEQMGYRVRGKEWGVCRGGRETQ